MSRSNSSIDNPYPVSGSSRSRRRLLLRRQQEVLGNPAEEEDATELVEDAGQVEIGNTELGLNFDDDLEPAAETDLQISSFQIESFTEPEPASDPQQPTVKLPPADLTTKSLAPHSILRSPNKSADVETLPHFLGIKKLFEYEMPVTWLFVGDGIAHGGQPATDQSNDANQRIYSEQFAQRVRWELKRFQDSVVTTATPDETVVSLLRGFEQKIARHQPTVVSIMLGLNDSVGGAEALEHFRVNLHQLIEAIRETHARPLLHTPHHIDLNSNLAPIDVRHFVRVIRDTSRQYEVPCIDHWEHWKQQAPEFSNRRSARWLADDGIHPSSAGQRELARLTMMRLGIFDHKSQVCIPFSNTDANSVSGTNG